MQTERDNQVSAGGLVIADESGHKHVALVETFSGGWVLPKGHVDPGETLETAALREVEEEAGLHRSALEVVKYLGAFEYNEHDPAARERKKNHFFLMRYKGAGLPALATDRKHASAAWHRLPLQGQNTIYDYQKVLIEEIFGSMLERTS